MLKHRKRAGAVLLKLWRRCCTRVASADGVRCVECCPCRVQISMTFKNQQVLKNCTWEVKKGERVGLVGKWGANRGVGPRSVC